MVSSEANPSQRRSDIRFLFGDIRERASEERLRNGTYNRRDNFLPNALSWFRKLDSKTLREYSLEAENPAPKFTENLSYLNRPWGSPTTLLHDALIDGDDDTSVALRLFIARIITPFEQGSKRTQNGIGKSLITSDVLEHLTGVMDTLHYHGEYIDERFTEGIIDGNIFHASLEARDGLEALLRVVDTLLDSDKSVLFLRDENYYSPEPPYSRLTSYDGAGTAWLSNGELVKYILENPERSERITSVMLERNTDDVGVIQTVIESDVMSVIQSGVL